MAWSRADDPWFFSPGWTTITDRLSELKLEVYDPSASAFYCMKMDSTVPGHEFLYDLLADARLSLGDSLNLGIVSTSNPVLGLNDPAINARLRSMFAASANTASLTSPFTTAFDLSSAYDCELVFYSVAGADAHIVPEPTSLALLAIAGLIATRRTRRRGA